LLQRFVLPLAERVVKAPVEEGAMDDKEVCRLLEQVKGVLKAVFETYAQRSAPKAGNKSARRDSQWAQVEKALAILDQQELIKMSEDLGLVPKFLSKMEVGRLLKAISVERTLNFQQFLDWITRAAIRGFSKDGFHDEFPTMVSKVEKMLSIIDNSSVVMNIQNARGRSHHRAFARRHNESLASRVQERHQSAEATQRDSVQRTKHFIEQSEHAAAFQRVFQFYCSYGEERPMETMKGFMFYKFCRDCAVLDDSLSYERVDLIFLNNISSKSNAAANKKVRMTYNQFIAAVMEVAQRKFPNEQRGDDFTRLLNEHVLPLARKADTEAPTLLAYKHPSVLEVLAQETHSNIVRLIFYYYVRNEAKKAAITGDLMSLRDVLRFAKDFGISSRMASHQELARMFSAAGGLMSKDDDTPSLDYEGWQQLLCRLAMHWGRIDDTAPANEVARRLTRFLQSLENSEAMITVESWRVRTQTHKRALYKFSA